MKFFPTLYAYLFDTEWSGRNLKLLLRLMGILMIIVLTFSGVFHWLMRMEGQKHTFITGIYWTLTVMSTLGFGDITFSGDAGRLFSMVVLMTGMISLLVVMPFSFIKFFYEPWMEAQAAARAPKKVDKDVSGHVILINHDPVTAALIKKLKQYGYPYVLVVKEVEMALRLTDAGIKVVVGEPDNPATYRNARLEKASLVAATANDIVNTNIAFTVRELSEEVSIITTANAAASVDILQLAGSSHVVELGEMMGQFLARRTIGGDARAHVIGRFDNLLIAEATAAGTPLVGKTLQESRLRELIGMTVVGIWDRGAFRAPSPETEVTSNSVLVLAGSEDQVRTYNELFCIYHLASKPVIVVGGGRVGRATGRALLQRQMESVIVEQRPERIRDPERYVHGNAAELEVLERAGIREAPAVIITTHDDDTNIYLTIYCRKLRPDIQIISRSTLERNVSTLHRAGADFVMSYASMGANTIFNLLERSDILMVAEGLSVFRVKVPEALEDRTLAASAIRRETGCSVIALNIANSSVVSPDPGTYLDREMEMILIGSVEAEKKFLKKYGAE